MTFEPGDIILTPFSYTDLSKGKQRPALILSARAYNEGPDVVACAITSNLKDSVYSVLVETGDLSTGELPKPSRIKVGKISTIQRTMIIKVVGRVKPAILRAVRKEFHSLFPL